MFVWRLRGCAGQPAGVAPGHACGATNAAKTTTSETSGPLADANSIGMCYSPRAAERENLSVTSDGGVARPSSDNRRASESSRSLSVGCARPNVRARRSPGRADCPARSERRDPRPNRAPCVSRRRARAVRRACIDAHSSRAMHGPLRRTARSRRLLDSPEKRRSGVGNVSAKGRADVSGRTATPVRLMRSKVNTAPAVRQIALSAKRTA